MMVAILRLVTLMQFLGLAGSIVGATAGYTFGERFALGYGLAGVAAVLLDVVAIRSRSNVESLIAAGLKPVVTYVFSIAVGLGGPARGSAGPVGLLFIGPSILLGSSAPSILGALGRWLRR